MVLLVCMVACLHFWKFACRDGFQSHLYRMIGILLRIERGLRPRVDVCIVLRVPRIERGRRPRVDMCIVLRVSCIERRLRRRVDVCAVICVPRVLQNAKEEKEGEKKKRLTSLVCNAD